MSGIACPFCSQKFPANELISHCRLCRNSRDGGPSAETQRPQPTPTQPPAPEAPQTPVTRVTRPRTEQDNPLSRSDIGLTEAMTPVTGRDTRVECSYCGRKFAPDRLDKHMQACAKLTNRKSQVFNPHEQRWNDLGKEDRKLLNEAEPMTPSSSMVKSRTPAAKGKLNWGKPTEEFGKRNTPFLPQYDDGHMAAVSPTPGAPRKPVEHSPIQTQTKAPTPPPPSTEVQSGSIPATSVDPEHRQARVTGDSQSTDRDAPASQDTHSSRHRHRHRKSSRSATSTPLVSAAPQAPQVPYAYPMQPNLPAPPIQAQPPLVHYQQAQQIHGPMDMYSLPPRVLAVPPEHCTFCIYCGLRFHEGAIFCGNCGSKRLTYDGMYHRQG